MDMLKIKPCPVCKSPASVANTVFGWFAECNKYGNIHNARTFGAGFGATKEDAIEAWNRRVSDENDGGD